MANDNQKRKELKNEFLRYLEKRIPAWQMPATKYFNSFNEGVKRYAKKHNISLKNILDIVDTDELKSLKKQMEQKENMVYAHGDKSKSIEGIEYYISFLEERQKQQSKTEVTSSNPDINSAPTESNNNKNADTNKDEQEDEEDEKQRVEGRLTEAKILRHQRNRQARQQCLEASGYKCYICEFDFEKVYGEIGKGFLEVHHKKPISTYDGEHPIPQSELCALCSNCHSMVHRRKNETLDVDKLKQQMKELKNKCNNGQ